MDCDGVSEAATGVARGRVSKEMRAGIQAIFACGQMGYTRSKYE